MEDMQGRMFSHSYGTAEKKETSWEQLIKYSVEAVSYMRCKLCEQENGRRQGSSIGGVVRSTGVYYWIVDVVPPSWH